MECLPLQMGNSSLRVDREKAWKWVLLLTHLQAQAPLCLVSALGLWLVHR